ncbi:hypothetical protein D6833_07810, partial [Candidatus Parcubacteria bacterium]
MFLTLMVRRISFAITVLAYAGAAIGGFFLAAPFSFAAASPPPCDLTAASERLLIARENILL